jgi:cardiolipin synthase
MGAAVRVLSGARSATAAVNDSGRGSPPTTKTGCSLQERPGYIAGMVEYRVAGPGPLNIPNLITLGRVILVPIVFWLLVSGQTKLAFFAFVLAGVSDAVDGFIAKRFGLSTELGAYLDPLADKLLLVSIFVALGVMGALPSWLVIAVVSRDILIVVGVMLSWLLDHPIRIRPLAVSKLNTVAQIVLAGTVLADDGFGLGLETLRFVLVWIAGVLTIASLAVYLRAWLRHMSG